jgi:hypothetical protein
VKKKSVAPMLLDYENSLRDNDPSLFLNLHIIPQTKMDPATEANNNRK